MLDHLSIGVRDLEAARKFYDALLQPLGHSASVVSELELAYGPGGTNGQFYLYPVIGDQVAGLGSHVAFSADSRKAVGEAYEAAFAQGATTIRAAGEHPDISPTYYGAIILDPDGNKMEIVTASAH